MVAFADLDTLGLHVEILFEIFDHCVEVIDHVIDVMQIFEHRRFSPSRIVATASFETCRKPALWPADWLSRRYFAHHSPSTMASAIRGHFAFSNDHRKNLDERTSQDCGSIAQTLVRHGSSHSCAGQHHLSRA
jgi:hypothetical protein